MCDNMADDDYCYNNDELVEWYNGYKQRKVQRAQTKEDFMPTAWDPTIIQNWCITEDEKKRIKEMLTQGKQW